MAELLRPRMADVYREKVGSLCLALESEESRTAARGAIRALMEALVLEPDGERLNITLKEPLQECWAWPETARGRRIPATSCCPNKVGCGGRI